MLIVALLVLVTTAVGRVRLDWAGAPTKVLLGAIVIGACLLAFVVGTWLWYRRSTLLRADLCRRHPEAVVDIARRDDFRAFIDLDALGVAERDLPFFVVLVADGAGIAVWSAGDPGVAPRRLAGVPWSRLGPLELTATVDTLPHYVVETTVDGAGLLQLTFGGVIPRSYARTLRTLDALEAVRAAAAAGARP